MSTKKINIHPLNVPKWEAGVINTMHNDAILQQKKIIDYIMPIQICSNQYPYLKKAKKSVSAFNIRCGQTLGTMVTLHKKALFCFLTLFNCSLLPKLQKWEDKKQIVDKKSLVYAIGMPELHLWPFGIKKSNSGAFIQFIAKQKKNTGLFQFFLSYYSIKK